MQTSSAPALQVNAAWSDRGKLGIPHDGSLAATTGTVNGSAPSVYAGSVSAPGMRVLGAPVFDHQTLQYDADSVAAGAHVVDLVQQLEAAGQIKPGYSPRPERGQMTIVLNDRGGVSHSRSGVFSLSDTTEPAASAIKAILELNRSSLAEKYG